MKGMFFVALFIVLTANVKGQADVDPLGYMKRYYNEYSDWVTPGTAKYVVDSRDELVAALKKVKSGECVYISDKAVINCTGLKYLSVNAGVTLASGRRKNGSAGALLYTDSLNTSPLFYVNGDNARITGLRIKGPDTARQETLMRNLVSAGKYYSIPTSRAIECKFKGLTIDNCELYGWTQAAIFLRDGASGARIHHNYIHHNQRQGLGYGICLDVAIAKVYNNVFEWNNHSVAATGKKGTSYEAYNNIILNSIPDSQIFDMHGGKDRNDGTDIAGDSVVIYNNVIYSRSNIFGIRGKPLFKYEIHDNVFINGTNNFRSLRDISTRSFMRVYDNKQVRSN